jgi:Tol biopolymer transport system component
MPRLARFGVLLVAAVGAAVPGVAARDAAEDVTGRLAVDRGNRLELADLDGSNRRSVALPRGEVNWDVAWSPDGRSIALTRGPSALVAGVNGGVRRVDRRSRFVGSPTWSPDGRALAYDWWNGRAACDRHARSDAGIAVADISGGRRWTLAVQPQRLNPKRARSFSVADWHPTRPRVLYYMEEWTPGDCGLYLGGRLIRTTLAHVGINGGKPTVLATDGAIGSASVSPDGTRVAFVAGRCDVFIVGLDGSGKRKMPIRVESGQGCYARGPVWLAWAPTGRALYASGDEEVLVINVRTGTGEVIYGGDWGLSCNANFTCVSEVRAVSSSGTVAVWAEGGADQSALWLLSRDGVSRTRYPSQQRASIYLP